MILLKQFFRGFKRGFHCFGENIAVIINSILLSLVYLIGVGLTSLIVKIFKKNFFETRFSKEKDSYWTTLNLGKKPIHDYYRLF